MISKFFLVFDNLAIELSHEAVNRGLHVISRRVRVDFTSKRVNGSFGTVCDLIFGKHDMHRCNAVVMAFYFCKLAFQERTQMLIDVYVVSSDI